MTVPTFIENTSDFIASGEIWHDVAEKVLPSRAIIVESLCENLKMSDYSPQVRQHLTFYVCLIPESKFHRPEEGRYSPQKRHIFQTFNLDYQQIMEASETEVLAIMAQKYLDGISKINTFWGMKSTPFDTEKFYQDVKNVFEKKGFL